MEPNLETDWAFFVLKKKVAKKFAIPVDCGHLRCTKRNMSNLLPIKMWQENDKPREKMATVGPKYLSDSELLALVINNGNKRESAVDISRRLLAESKHGLYGLARSDYQELLRFSGIGKAKACQLMALFELSARIEALEIAKPVKIMSSKCAYDSIKGSFSNQTFESFWVIFLDRANHIVRKKQISDGGLFSTSVDPIKIYKTAVLECATGLILVHNHPSNNLQASKEDINITEQLKHGARLLNITVLDHLIIGNGAYLSFKDQGLVF